MLKLSRCFVAVTVVLVPVAAQAQSLFPDRCKDGRPLPFSAIENRAHPIDKTCGANGNTASPANSQTQNLVKNNFCATTPGNKPEAYTTKMLVDLQGKTQVPSGHGKEPTSRKALQDLGEGKVIRVKAFLVEAHHADLGSGESVNCNLGDEEGNDVHIALGPDPATKECDSVTAEISPHYRPDTWHEIGHFELFDSGTKKYTVNAARAARLQAHPYRITGQLFFDASHEVCPCGATCAPSRSSLWEIHPVYDIEVCKAGTQCDETNDAHWLPFDTWWKALAPIQPVAPPHSHHPPNN